MNGTGGEPSKETNVKLRKYVLLSLAALSAPAWAQTCQPTAITPYLNINGSTSWVQKSSASLNAGSRVVLGPQPFNGSWSWSGCGASGSSREQSLKLTTSCTATATFTNSCGAKSTQAYNFKVWPAPTANTGKFVIVDQFGYLTNMNKIAVLRVPKVGYDSGQSFWPQQELQVINSDTGQVVYHNYAGANWKNYATDPSSGDIVLYFDFSSVKTPGTYEIYSPAGDQHSARFEIGDNVYRNVLVQALHVFFYQRAGQAKSASYAGEGWADGASHMGAGQDTQARRFLDKNNAATARDLRGGWYDAGDLNKYTPSTAGYAKELLAAYLMNPSVWTDDFNIPESYNGIPDILDEAKWGLDFLMRMQNADGSVLSIVGEAGASPPSAATGASYYGDVNTNSTLAVAAAFARGARVYRTLNNSAMNAYADELQRRAVLAWNWAAANPKVIFKNNDAASGTAGLGVGPVETDDNGRAVGRLEAAIELFALTGNAAYRSVVDANYTLSGMFSSWTLSGNNAPNSRALLFYASLPGATPAVASDIRARYLDLVTRPTYYPSWGAYDDKRDPYMAFIADYTWSSNAVKANQGAIFWDDLDYGISGRSRDMVIDASAGYLHYLHGVNPLGKVYLSNMVSFGAENSVNEIWHTWFPDGSAKWDSAATSTYGPAPGFLVGGPVLGWTWESGCPNLPGCGSAPPTPPYGQPAQKSYKDFNTGWPLSSWSVSEPSDGYQVAYLQLLARFVK
jgi:hypothetical protein